MRIFIVCLFFASTAFAQLNGSGSLTSGGINRSFVFHLPNANPDCNLPLLIVYHGDGGTGAGIQSYAGFDALSNSQNFIVVYPNSTTIWGSLQWNKYADNQPGFAPSGETNAADDVQFTSDLIDYFANNYAINRNRVYVTGHSGGGFMCYFLSIALNNKIAAFAPVAASVWGENSYLNTYFSSGASVKVPILHIHGTADGTVDFPIPNYSPASPPSWVWPESSYGSLNCNISAYTTTAYNASVDNLSFCSTNKKVILAAIKGWGHGWATLANGGYDTPTEVWNFVKTFSLSTFSTPVLTPPTVTPPSASITTGQSQLISASNCPAGALPLWSTGVRANSVNIIPSVNTTYTAKCFGCNSSQTAASVITVGGVNTAPVVDTHFKIDQFGYQTNAQKIAVISNPISGYNSVNNAFTPSSTLEIRRLFDNVSVFSGSITTWNGGATHDQSGDKVWWFDFSALTTNGEYYIYDAAQNKQSFAFEIRQDVYKNVLKHAVRAFFYQRCGIAKATYFGGKKWNDNTACHTHANQDLDCRLVTDVSNASLAKNLSGGWHDAGDYNKYTNFTYEPVHDLLYAYQEKPGIWTDDFGIPESGNNVPDILDEIKWELDWLLKMQNADGSVLNKVSVTDFSATSPPSADLGARRYGPASTSSTLTAASVFAHAAIVFGSTPSLSSYTSTLQTAAINAWTWAAANPNVVYTNAGFQSANPERAAYDYQTALKLSAAAYLFALTGNETYKTAFDGSYANAHLIQWTFAYPFEAGYQDALLYYAFTAGATATVAAAIKNKYTSSLQNTDENLPSFTGNTDAYRAYLKTSDYTWGSNTTKGHKGSMYYAMVKYSLNAANATNYENASRGFVHYFHGVNPIGKVYLTNMYDSKADSSINEIYHSWFGDGTVYDNALTSPTGPPPGFVPGGANPTYAPDPSYGSTISPPQNNPAQKSYKDWNTSYPQNSWTISEIGIYTQAAYVRALSKFVENVPCPDNVTVNTPTSAATTVQAQQAIRGNNLVIPNAPATFQSGKSILLEKGFEALQGSTFSAKVNGCN
ncbi:glycoside hydrolase family 9 protein [Runella sp.]|uniref:glycoside hydrolase family 9 protein n=1 Tax=Runella sp. TaxID=1960881 RepID=UPI003D0FCBB6